MASPLFAFQLARPIEVSDVSEVEYSYDPQSQTLIWGGDGAPAAVYCTRSGRGYSRCSNYQDYPGCYPSGSQVSNGYHCDH